MRRLGGTVGRSLPLAGGFAARVPAAALPALRRASSVAGVWSDARVAMRSGRDCLPGDAACYDALPPEATWQRAIGLDRVPNKYQGDGVTVASIDTGVTPTPNLGARLLARVDLTSERDGIDHFGHGTHMAGVIAGGGVTTLEAFEGSAPETSLVSVKVAGWDGATDVSTVIAALQWVVSNRARFNIRVVNLSWGTDASRGYGVDPLDRAVERAWEAGLVVVVAAGNEGPAAGTISKPADDPYVVTVGAADTNGTADDADDTVARVLEPRADRATASRKPDLLAPGVSIVSDRAPGSTIDLFRPAARLGPTMFKGSGTSQAAAVVAGVAARMLDVDPTLTNDEVKGVLIATADRRLAGPGGGAGMIDALAATTAVDAAEEGPGAGRCRSRTPGLKPSTGTGLARGQPRHAARLRATSTATAAPTRSSARSTRSAAPGTRARTPPRSGRRRRGWARRGRRWSRSSPARLGDRAPRRRAGGAPRRVGARVLGRASGARRGLGREVLGREVLGRQVLGHGRVAVAAAAAPRLPAPARLLVAFVSAAGAAIARPCGSARSPTRRVKTLDRRARDHGRERRRRPLHALGRRTAARRRSSRSPTRSGSRRSCSRRPARRRSAPPRARCAGSSRGGSRRRSSSSTSGQVALALTAAELDLGARRRRRRCPTRPRPGRSARPRPARPSSSTRRTVALIIALVGGQSFRTILLRQPARQLAAVARQRVDRPARGDGVARQPGGPRPRRGAARARLPRLPRVGRGARRARADGGHGAHRRAHRPRRRSRPRACRWPAARAASRSSPRASTACSSSSTARSAATATS